MRIYIDQSMCDELGVTYYGRNLDEEIQICPHDLIAMRRYSGGYDQKHMDFFNDIGEFTILRLKNEGLGWWSVV